MFSIFGVHHAKRGRWRLVFTAPFIYGMVIPLALMDLCTSIYQRVSFPAYGIPCVPRKKYVQLVKRGLHLNALDRFHCAYCSYANGVCAYLRAVLIETEKYWCPIKYKARVGYEPPHPQKAYAEDGDTEALKKVLE
jgi:hypothetical protein